MRLHSLAHLLTRRGDHERVAALYREACEEGELADSGWALRTALHWEDWAGWRLDWADAADAYDGALAMTQRLFGIQLLREQKESALRAASVLAGSTARALVGAGRIEAAALAVERARALMLSEALERDRADLTTLAAGGRPDLVRRYEQASDRLSALGHRALAASSGRLPPGHRDRARPPLVSGPDG
ncbi:hypothetical protein [Nonomuraea sp. NPDC003201]